jgi:hypothetical protein
VAKSIATVSGVALVPGVSKNGRLYTREVIAKAVARAQGRIADGSEPITILTHHEAGDDSTRTIGRITGMSVAEDGSARFNAVLADTPHAKNIAGLADPSGKAGPFLSGMSIRGAWVGKVRRVRGPAGDPVETADDLELFGIDPTHRPGVTGAGIDAFAWAADGANETTERVLITESVEACVTITEDAPAVSQEVREASRALLPLDVPHLLANGICVTCPPVAEATSDPAKPYGDVVYADTGYQKDGKKRYPLDSPAHVRSAWSFISQAKNAAMYTAAQLKRVKGRIKAAMGKIGAKVAAEGWTVDPAIEITEALVEYYGGDPESCGSYSLSATNGPTTVTVCSYGLDPADLQVILAQACKGAGLALSAIDPDMDGDVDLPGDDPGESAPDDDGAAESFAARLAAAIRGESAETLDAVLAEMREADSAVTETAPEDPAPEPAAANREGTEVPAVSETTTTTEAAGTVTATAPAAPVIPQDIMDKAMRKAAKKAAERALAATGTAPAESAPAPAAAAAVTESGDERIARLVREGVAAALAADAPPQVTETEDERVKRLVSEAIVRERQEITASGGGPARKGLVAEHAGSAASSGEIPADFPMKNGAMIPTEEWTDDQRRAVGVQLERHVLGSRASS